MANFWWLFIFGLLVLVCTITILIKNIELVAAKSEKTLSFMGIQGVGHNLGTLITGSYYGGFSGGFTGVILTCLSIPSIYYLLKTMPPNKNN